MFKIKVCGMRDAHNIEQLVELPFDYIGFIFYPQSPRYVRRLESDTLSLIPDSIKKVGVFVNDIPSRVMSYIKDYKLDSVQLHGYEDPHYCQFLKSKSPDTDIIKAFSISEEADLKMVHKYVNCCDYFLFDTKTANYGGSGEQFDWSVLNSYEDNIPFFLSGGISADDIDNLLSFSHPMLYAIDINSKFETEPGIKDVELIKEFIEKIR